MIHDLHEQGRQVQILDIAAGAGRYVIEVMHELSEIPIRAVLRDYRDENVEAARSWKAKGLAVCPDIAQEHDRKPIRKDLDALDV